MPHSFFSPIAGLCLLLLLACSGGCAGQSAPAPEAPNAPLATLGAFSVLTLPPDPETGLTPLAVRYQDRDISQTPDPMRLVEAQKSVSNFPLPGCDTLAVEMFTGGANCCFGYYLLTSCPDGSHAGYIEPRDGGLGGADQALRAYPVDDGAFLYYTLETAPGKSELFFSRAESPRMTRFLVFDAGKWRADQVGEFAAAYQALLAGEKEAGNMNQTAKAVTLAYYATMAGEKPAAVSRLLRASLPREHARFAPVILRDITAAIHNFAPVQAIDLAR